LTILFTFLVESTKVEKKIDYARNAIGERGETQTRLQTIFSTVDRVIHTEINRKGKRELLFEFDHGIDPEPLFSGKLNGKLWVDPEKQLCITFEPLEKKGKKRTTVLLTHVENLEFEFLGKTRAAEHGKNEKSTPITLELCWRSDWSISDAEIPNLIRLIITQKNSKEPIRFAFFLPTPNPQVVYRESAV
jgi:hypothetical protein